MEDLKNEERTVAHTVKIKPSVNRGLTLELLDENEGVKRQDRKSIATKIAEILEERHKRRNTPVKKKRNA